MRHQTLSTSRLCSQRITLYRYAAMIRYVSFSSLSLMPRALFSFAGFSREAETRGPFDGAILHGSPGISDDSDAQRVVVQHGMAQCCHIWPSKISLYMSLFSRSNLKSQDVSSSGTYGNSEKTPETNQRRCSFCGSTLEISRFQFHADATHPLEIPEVEPRGHRGSRKQCRCRGR